MAIPPKETQDSSVDGDQPRTPTGRFLRDRADYPGRAEYGGQDNWGTPDTVYPTGRLVFDPIRPPAEASHSNRQLQAFVPVDIDEWPGDEEWARCFDEGLTDLLALWAADQKGQILIATGTDFSEIEKRLLAAMQGPAPSIVLDFDTYTGQIAGHPDLMDLFYKPRNPVVKKRPPDYHRHDPTKSHRVRRRR